MSDIVKLKQRLFEEIVFVLDDKTSSVSEGTSLIGDGSVLDSMKLIELCLSLEDMSAELGFEFDWTSDAAMSKSRSMFRTAGALANKFVSQMQSKK